MQKARHSCFICKGLVNHQSPEAESAQVEVFLVKGYSSSSRRLDWFVYCRRIICLVLVEGRSKLRGVNPRKTLLLQSLGRKGQTQIDETFGPRHGSPDFF